MECDVMEGLCKASALSCYRFRSIAKIAIVLYYLFCPYANI